MLEIVFLILLVSVGTILVDSINYDADRQEEKAAAKVVVPTDESERSR